jgi:potassium efflux system protein
MSRGIVYNGTRFPQEKSFVFNQIQAGSRVFGLVLLAIVAAVPCARAQEDPATGAASVPAPEFVTAESIQFAIDRLSAASGMDESVKARALELYTQAMEETRIADQWAQKSAEFENTIATAPEKIQQLEAQLAEPLPPPTVEIAEDATLAEVEQLLTQAEADLAAAQAAEATLRQRIAEQQTRRRQVPELTTAAQVRLEEVRAAEATVTVETPELAAAQAALQMSRRRAIEAELNNYAKAIASQDIRSQLVTLEHDLAVRQAARLDTQVGSLRETVTERRVIHAREAEEAARVAVLEAAQASPVVREQAQELAESIRKLSEQRTDLLEAIRTTEENYAQIDSLLNRLELNYSSVEERVTAAGLTNAVGLLLRRYRSELPDTREHAGNIRLRQETISEAELTRINFREDRFALANLESALAPMMENMPPAMDDQRREEVSNLLLNLLRTKRDNLDAVLQNYDIWFDRVLSLDAEEQALVTLTEEFQVFIDERILWIRSADPVSVSMAAQTLDAGRRLIQPRNWMQTLQAFVDDMAQTPLVHLFALLILLVLLGLRRRLRASRAAASEVAAKAFCTSFTPTVEVLLHCVLLALPGPVLMWFLGWRLNASLAAPEFASSIGFALMQSARWYFLVSLTRQVLLPNSLGDAHFDWPGRAIRSMRRHLGWFLLVIVLAAFTITLVFGLDDQDAMDSVGRIIYAVNMLGLGLFLHLMLRQGSPVVREWIEVRGSAALQRARRTLHLAGTLAPLTFLVLAGAGYFYTALRLTGRFYMTIALILTIILASRLVLRWLLLTRRRLAMEQARKRRAAVKARASEDGEGDTAAAEEPLDLTIVDMQTQRLLRSVMVFFLILGVWYVWVDELPAINILKNVELWSSTEIVALTNADPNAATVVESVEQRTSVTLAHLVLAVLVALMTLAATRNLPGLLEIVVLQRMNLAAGERYAFTAVMRYVIVIIGAAYAFTVIGLGWSKVQWLVAALGVGLGFGLQEIFGNFISGLILLFERPIRVGDIVTVSNVSGTVSQIRIRATTIRDFDQKELVVPNKEFVVGQVVNWTLSDSILRVIVKVGIAYGSDPRKAREMLLQIVKEHPRILEEPAPMVHFMEFGDNALQFEIRLYIAGLEHNLDVNNDIRMTITERFSEAGIEIAYPQRDIHIRSMPAGLPIELPDRAPARGPDSERD